MFPPGLFRYEATRPGSNGLVDRLTVHLRHGGVYKGPNGPGSWPLGSGTFEKCDTCIVLSIGCDTRGDCEEVYFGTEGTLQIIEWSADSFTYEFESVILREVNVHNTVAIMPVLMGKTWCLHADGDTVTTTPDTAPITPSPGCLTEGTGPFVGHNVADFSLPNCLGEQVSLHSTCGESNALWITGTTGWCNPCSAKLKELAKEHGGYLSREIVASQTPGLDMWVILSQNHLKQAPDPAFCMDYAEEHHMDPAMILMDHNPAGIPVPMIEPEGESHVYESMATTWSHINPYLSKDLSAGGVRNIYPWNALLRGDNMEYHWSDNVGTSSLTAAKKELLTE